MDMAPLIMIITSIFLPMTSQLGMDPVYFGTMRLLNLETLLVSLAAVIYLRELSLWLPRIYGSG